MRALNDLERKVLKALTDDFMSASVVKIRAGIDMKNIIGPTVGACIELERRGMAERAKRASFVFWRKASNTRLVGRGVINPVS